MFQTKLKAVSVKILFIYNSFKQQMEGIQVFKFGNKQFGHLSFVQVCLFCFEKQHAYYLPNTAISLILEPGKIKFQ